MQKHRLSRPRVGVRWCGALVGAFVLGLAASQASALSRAEGKRLFVQKCGDCHGMEKQAPSVNPAQFAGLQWRNWFRRQKHQPFSDLSSLTLEDKRAILEYLVSNAADSDYPETAAIP